jgi:hypothetical protein
MGKQKSKSIEAGHKYTSLDYLQTEKKQQIIIFLDVNQKNCFQKII